MIKPTFVALLIALVAAPAEAQVAKGPWGGKMKGVGKYAKVNGLELYYSTQGQGKAPPLILLHGGAGASEMYLPIMPVLARGRQLISVDLQGHGRTADIDRPLDPVLMADDIAALVKQLGLASVDVMGYSLGGAVALQVAIRHPELVRRLVVVSAVHKRGAIYPEVLAMASKGMPPEALEMMKSTPMYQLYASLAPRPEDFMKLMGKLSDVMKNDFDISKQVSEIKAPTLVVAADADMFPPSAAAEMFGLLGGGKKDAGWDGKGRPASQLAILPGLTHYNIFASPLLAQAAVPFLDAELPAPKSPQ